MVIPAVSIDVACADCYIRTHSKLPQFRHELWNTFPETRQRRVIATTALNEEQKAIRSWRRHANIVVEGVIHLLFANRHLAEEPHVRFAAHAIRPQGHLVATLDVTD